VFFFFSRGGAQYTEVERSTRSEEQWWTKMIKEEDKTCIEHSGKLILLFEILNMAEQIGDKVYVL
jgi:transcriptional regulator ATRX